MSDENSIFLWSFLDDGDARGYFSVENYSGLGEFIDQSQWAKIDCSLWTSDGYGNVTGYYQVKDVSGLGSFTEFVPLPMKKNRCKRKYGKKAYKCNRGNKRCCCRDLPNGGVQVIANSCKKKKN